MTTLRFCDLFYISNLICHNILSSFDTQDLDEQISVIQKCCYKLVSVCFYNILAHVQNYCLQFVFLEQFTPIIWIWPPDCCHIDVAAFVLKTKIWNDLGSLYIKLIRMTEMSERGTVTNFSEFTLRSQRVKLVVISRFVGNIKIPFAIALDAPPPLPLQQGKMVLETLWVP